VGRQHLANVNLIAKELGMTVVVANAFKSDATDADLDQIVGEVAKARPDLYINHGSAGLYQKLITKARNAGLKTMFMGVNSGSSQIAKGLGELAFGMVFAQVVPSPWERKREITREYQATALKANPNAEFSYGGLEGFLTAKALVRALQLAGNEPTRASFIKGLEGARIDLGGVSVRYASDNHEGSRYVDLALVRTDGRFTH
jgi:ABC-type branched-subunit amino acid transport system substrate-binding protein